MAAIGRAVHGSLLDRAVQWLNAARGDVKKCEIMGNSVKKCEVNLALNEKVLDSEFAMSYSAARRCGCNQFASTSDEE